MTKEELQSRIEKKKSDIAKLEKKVASYSRGLTDKDIAICEPFGNCVYGTKARWQSWRDYHGTPEYQQSYTNFKNYLATYPGDAQRLHELRGVYSELGEARNTLNKYEVELNKLTNFENEEKITVIWDFLMHWKELAREWYKRNAQTYFNLKKNYKDEYEKFKQQYDGKPAYYVERSWEKDYYSVVDALTKEITTCRGDYIYPDKENPWRGVWVYNSYDINEDLLEKTLDKEVKAKYQRLIDDITHITGEITDASGLSIGGKGDINGTVIGVNGIANVNTFSAGGWNIQCFHYRTKITRVK